MSVPLQPTNTAVFNYSQGNYITRVDTDGSGNPIYKGWAMPGVASSDAGWRIQQLNWSGSNFTNSAFPKDANGNPSCGFAFIWDNRTSYTYG